MKPAVQTRLLAVTLAVATLAACILAAFNFIAELSYQAPTDGVTWTEANDPNAAPGLLARQVPEDSPAGKVGIHVGDVLTTVNNHPTKTVGDLEYAVNRTGVWLPATYTIRRGLAEFDANIVLEPLDRDLNQGM